jgi:hypothetical protein
MTPMTPSRRRRFASARGRGDPDRNRAGVRTQEPDSEGSALGGRGNDTLLGSPTPDMLFGDEGDDRLTALLGRQADSGAATAHHRRLAFGPVPWQLRPLNRHGGRPSIRFNGARAPRPTEEVAGLPLSSAATAPVAA